MTPFYGYHRHGSVWERLLVARLKPVIFYLSSVTVGLGVIGGVALVSVM